MSTYPGVTRKGPGRGWVYRWREFDEALGKVVRRTSPEFPSAIKAAADRSRHKREQAATQVARRNPTRQGQTIEGAWRLHPCTVREPEERTKRYAIMLKAFTSQVGYTELRRLSYPDVAAWVATLRGRGLAWATRCHYLLPLRRAAKMAPTLGLPDVLCELQIDERPDEQQQVATWSLAEVVQAWIAFKTNLQARVATGLGGFAGMRCSEIFRVRTGDLTADGRLPIGLRSATDTGPRIAKNRGSRRLLPLPQILLDDIRSLEGTRPKGRPLLERQGKQGPVAYTEITFAEWLGPLLHEKTGRDFTPKFLRKTFATWVAEAGFDFYECETYMGRETPITQSITARNYMADYYQLISKRLDGLAARISATILTHPGVHSPAPVLGALEKPLQTHENHGDMAIR